MSKNLGEMFRAYNKTRGIKLLENDYAFASYFINGKECVLLDFYTKPEQRQKGIGTDLFKKIEHEAINNGCEFISSNCDLRSESAGASMIAQVKAGFTPVSAHNNLVSFFKELK